MIRQNCTAYCFSKVYYIIIRVQCRYLLVENRDLQRTDTQYDVISILFSIDGIFENYSELMPKWANESLEEDFVKAVVCERVCKGQQKKPNTKTPHK